MEEQTPPEHPVVIELTEDQWEHFMETMNNPQPPTELMRRGVELMDKLRSERRPPPLPKEPGDWGASIVAHPVHIAEQRRQNQEARDMADGAMDPKEPA